MISNKYLSFFLAAGLLAAGCSSHIEGEEELARVEMPVSISIPVNGTMEGRGVGDPGQEEKWLFPTKAYIYICTSTSASETNCETVTYSELSLVADKWEQTTWTGNENIWTYNDKLTIRLPEQRAVGRVYVVLSTGNLTLSLTTPTTSTTENDIKALTFSIDADEDNTDLLKNLYSTPADKTLGNNSNNPNNYYGTIEEVSTKVPSLDIICYHVAAKLDLTWTVEEDVQDTKKMSYLHVSGLPTSGSLFYPVNTGTLTTGYSYTFLGGLSPGLMWYGRASTYTIYKPELSYTLTYKITEDGTETEGTKPLTMPSADSYYVPWLRGLITVGATATIGSE
ncbi:MAG: hypothetical protein LIO90_10610 [Bacteroidales bacterium]|nr:hypothetical protein [Bacteroidales bacterium]